MEVSKIKINDHGGAPFCEHNYPCPVYWEDKAILQMGKGHFEPGWRAQRNGWRLIQINSPIQRWVFKLFFMGK